MVTLPETAEKSANKTDYIAAETLYLNAAGQVVKHDDKTKLTKLVQAGGRLPREVAVKYGLADPVAAEPVITAPARIYTNEAGDMVKANDPSKMTLIAAAGGTLTEEQASKLGLKENTDAPESAGNPVSQPAQTSPQTRTPESPAQLVPSAGKGSKKR